MSVDGYDFAAARKRLRGMLAEKSPDYPASPSREEARAADRALIQSGALSESQLVALYAAATQSAYKPRHGKA